MLRVSQVPSSGRSLRIVANVDFGTGRTKVRNIAECRTRFPTLDFLSGQPEVADLGWWKAPDMPLVRGQP